MAIGKKVEGVITGVGLIGISLVIVLMILSGFGDASRGDATGVATIASLANNTQGTFTGFTLLQSAPASCIGTPVNNVSVGVVSYYEGDEVTDANIVVHYNVTYVGGINCTLTHKTSTTVSDTVENITTPLSNTTTWINILIIVAFAALVLGVYKSRKDKGF